LAIRRLLRKLGTGFLFAVFGIGGLILALVVIPANRWLRGGGGAPDLVAQRTIHRAFRLYVRLGTVLGLWSLAVERPERLRSGASLIVANHPSLMDVVFLISRTPQADCIVKSEAWRNPFLRWIVASAGYIPNDEGEAVIEACVERLRAGRSIILFPEGSRSPARSLGAFRRGAARIALASGATIEPVLIECEPPALLKGQPWYALPDRRLEYTLSCGEPFCAKDVVDPELPAPIAARRLTEHLRSYFEARLSHAEA
jgi:1-acyl-sn-glycerol-3-phosphate acyltransferase